MNINTKKPLLFAALLVPALLVTLLSFITLLFSTADIRPAMPMMRPLLSFKPSSQERPEATVVPSQPSPNQANEATAVTSPGKPPVQYPLPAEHYTQLLLPVVATGGSPTEQTGLDNKQADGSAAGQSEGSSGSPPGSQGGTEQNGDDEDEDDDNDED